MTVLTGGDSGYRKNDVRKDGSLHRAALPLRVASGSTAPGLRPVTATTICTEKPVPPFFMMNKKNPAVL